MLFLKQKIQQMEHERAEIIDASEAERADYAAQEAAARELQAKNAAVISELTVKIESYKAIEGSFGDRLKWALKKHS